MNEYGTNRAHHTLAIDIGSSSTRCEVYDGDLKPLPSTFSQKTYQLLTDSDGKAELDPENLLNVVCECIQQSIRAVETIDIVGTSCFWHSILGVDERFKPTTNVLMWADTRAAQSVHILSGEMDPGAHHQATGTRLHTSYPMAKLRWLRDEYPEVFDRTTRWMSFPEFLQYRLTGTLTISTSMASGTGFFDRTDLDWNQQALQHAGISADKLSPLSDEPVIWQDGRLWPQIKGAKWIPAVGDGAANNLGSYAVVANHPALMVGTTGALRLVTTNPPETLPPRLWQYRLDQQHALLGGALSEGGGVIAWLMDNLQAPDHETLEREISRAAPDEHGLTVLPYLAGERSPNWHSDAVGTIHGLRFDSNAANIVQATMESIGYSFAAILDDLSPLLEAPVEIIATGNALRLNQTWIQMIADICGHTLLMPRTTESSLRGAALHAMRQTGAEHQAPDLRSDSIRFEPQSEHRDRYAAARERQSKLYKLLVERSQ